MNKSSNGKKYNLLRRPWYISTNGISNKLKNEKDWSNLITLIKDFEKHKWPNNKLMKFKISLLSNQENIAQFLLELPKNDYWNSNSNKI
ncbi:MAG: hypothetical protein BAJALOKI2v1_280014 [Promethearchaeota archaeon]|nr:MAG: hypothetical protein BAJALOKI2v1_280014 [Candidatus Lokiarchaeota archaeon]